MAAKNHGHFIAGTIRIKKDAAEIRFGKVEGIDTKRFQIDVVRQPGRSNIGRPMGTAAALDSKRLVRRTEQDRDGVARENRARARAETDVANVADRLAHAA